LNLKTAATLLFLVQPCIVHADACLSTLGWQLRGELESRCESLEAGGRTRTYRIYVPGHLANPAPLVFVLHGGGGSGSAQERITKGGFNRIADSEGIIVAYPDGVGRNWNDGRSDVSSSAFKDNVDDVGFFKALLEQLAAKYPVDRKRVFATGMSNGGFMSYRLACDAADIFLAVAPVVAGLSVDLGPRCRPQHPVSVLILNGTEDPLIPWEGGHVGAFGISRGQTWSAMQTYEKWIELDACKVRSDEPEVNAVADDHTSVVRHRATACKGGAEVRLDEIRGGGHNWPRGAKYLGVTFVGRISQELDGNAEIWSFFKTVPPR
jgi:polyhydroxybutyrate depolymerase